VMLWHGDLQRQGAIPPFLAGAAAMLAGFYFALWKRCVPLVLIGSVALAVRVLLLWQAPGDDIYRYIWEGQLLLHHVNPYLHAPDAGELIPLRDAIWESVQHRTFAAIYPPLAEWAFALIALISPSVFFFKIVFASADLLAGGLLWRRYGGRAALLYLWNPLVIYSFAGGGHYDSIFVLALVLGWLAWDAGRFEKALCWIGVAVALKWVALPILAWAAWRRFRDSGWASAMSASVLGIFPLAASWTLVGLWSGEWTWHLHPENSPNTLAVPN